MLGDTKACHHHQDNGRTVLVQASRFLQLALYLHTMDFKMKSEVEVEQLHLGNTLWKNTTVYLK